jgi:aryl-alcohol dehydrogenase-like predicted oxidoreductase/enamine deaminase RidA (YjgF/YER057c/UK114 family)
MTSIDRFDLTPDLSISRVVTGLWQIADMERDGKTIDRDRAVAAIARYDAAGMTTFDMADHYGSAELIAGDYRRRAPQASVQWLTKWVPSPGPVSHVDVRAAVERALTRLGTNAIDLLQFHAWNYADPSWLEALFLLQDLKREGLIRQLGLTNVDTAHLGIVIASGIEVIANQVSFSLLDQRARRGMVPYCQAHGVHLLAYGTLAGGWLSERWLGRDEPDWERTGTWSQMKYGRFIRAIGGWEALQRVLHAAATVAARHGVSIANVASRYVLEQPGVAAVIVGARLGERDHIDDTRRLFTWRLSHADRHDLQAAIDTLHPIPGDCGDEYRRPPYLTASGDLSHHLETMPAPFRVIEGAGGRTVCLSGTSWERLAGYARAVRHGRRISVSGTTATLGDRLIGGRDAAAQTHFAIDKIEGALQSLGATLAHVVRTRVYVRNIGDWEAVARAHGARFGVVLPANTLVAATLVGDEYLVEIEADAELGDVDGDH